MSLLIFFCAGVDFSLELDKLVIHVAVGYVVRLVSLKLLLV